MNCWLYLFSKCKSDFVLFSDTVTYHSIVSSESNWNWKIERTYLELSLTAIVRTASSDKSTCSYALTASSVTVILNFNPFSLHHPPDVARCHLFPDNNRLNNIVNNFLQKKGNMKNSWNINLNVVSIFLFYQYRQTYLNHMVGINFNMAFLSVG